MIPPEEQAWKVVAHKLDGSLIKGYTTTVPLTDLAALLKEYSTSPPNQILVTPVGDEKDVLVSLESLKALFFVKTFEGSRHHEENKFFRADPRTEGLWVWTKFSDNETIEGVTRNSLQSLIEPGFFLKPTDARSNNEMIYVLKAALTGFRVLRVTTEY